MVDPTEPVVLAEPAVIDGLDHWRTLPIAQQPKWPSPQALAAASAELAILPPLVFAGEVDILRSRLASAARGEAFLLDLEGDHVRVWRERSGTRSELGQVDLQSPVAEQLSELHNLRGRIEDPSARSILCIPGTRALVRGLTLPLAAEENLRQVLSFEMDRQTPFKADQVYFDGRVLLRNPAARTMQVELVVLPRAQLDAQIAGIAGGALELDGVDIWQDDAVRRHINLLPPERRARRRNVRLPLNLGLAAFSIILLLVNMSESLGNRAVALEAMSGEVAKANAQALQVSELRKTLQDSIAGANFLADKKLTNAPIIALLDDVARRLNDDTYLERLQIDNQQVQLQGQSKEAANLISVLAASEYLANPNLQGQIQPDPRSGKERFQIQATLKPVNMAEAPPTAPSAGVVSAAATDAGTMQETTDGGV